MKNHVHKWVRTGNQAVGRKSIIEELQCTVPGCKRTTTRTVKIESEKDKKKKYGWGG